MKRYIFTLLLTLAALAVMFSYDGTEAAVSVETTTAWCRDITRSVEAGGELRALRSRSLGSMNYAVVDRIYVNVGDSVKAGQVLMTFASNDTPSTDGIVDTLTSAGIEALYGGISDSFTELVSDEIVCPFDGIVTAISIREGEQATPLMPCVTVSDTARMLAVIKLSESDASKVAAGMPAVVRSDNIAYSGVITEISPVIKTVASLTGSSERYCEATVELYHPEGAISGASATALISTARREGALLVPYEAIQQDRNMREYVYVVRDGCAAVQVVTTGEEFDLMVEVLSGIDAEDRLIISAASALEDGMAVEVSG